MNCIVLVQYGFTNMVAHSGDILNVTAIQVITTNITSPSSCITNCIHVEQCNSVNVVEIPQSAGKFECQLLDTDRFRNASNFVTQRGSTHYAISVRLKRCRLSNMHNALGSTSIFFQLFGGKIEVITVFRLQNKNVTYYLD